MNWGRWEEEQNRNNPPLRILSSNDKSDQHGGGEHSELDRKFIKWTRLNFNNLSIIKLVKLVKSAQDSIKDTGQNNATEYS